jgi:hypothetical protein
MRYQRGTRGDHTTNTGHLGWLHDLDPELYDEAAERAVARVWASLEAGLAGASPAAREAVARLDMTIEPDTNVRAAIHEALARTELPEDVRTEALSAIAATHLPVTPLDLLADPTAEVLPLPEIARAQVVALSRAAGLAGNDLGMQLGGWSVSWQGGRGRTTEGTTFLQALQEASDAEVAFSRFGRFDERASLGIAVVGEEPYAEGDGDDPLPSLDEADLVTIRRLRGMVDTLVVVVYPGRPILLGEAPVVADAVVAGRPPRRQRHQSTSFQISGSRRSGWPISVNRVTACSRCVRASSCRPAAWS